MYWLLGECHPNLVIAKMPLCDVCISYLLLCNKPPDTYGLKQPPCYFLQFLGWLGLFWLVLPGLTHVATFSWCLVGGCWSWGDRPLSAWRLSSSRRLDQVSLLSLHHSKRARSTAQVLINGPFFCYICWCASSQSRSHGQAPGQHGRGTTKGMCTEV